MQNTNVTGERIRELRKKKGLKAIDLASSLNINRSRVSNWELGVRNPQNEELIRLADKLDVSPAYLKGWINEEVYSTHQPIEQNVFTRRDGTEIQLRNTNSDHAYSEQFLKQRGLKARQLIALTSDDDAMSGVVNKGDTVLIDMQRQRSNVRDLFAILTNDRIWIRWIRPEIDGGYTISAEDATQYPDMQITIDQLEALDIIGRIARIERDR